MRREAVLRGICALLLLSGCVSQRAVDSGNLSLNYTPPQSTQKTDIVLGLIGASYIPKDQTNTKTPSVSLPMGLPAISIAGAQIFNPNEYFVTQYSKQTQKTVTTDLQRILIARGATIKAFKNEDELVYGDKKDLDLIAAPEIDLGIQTLGKKVSSNLVGVVTEEGSYQATGSVSLSFKEPLTGQKVLVKRINLEDLSAPQPYKLIEKRNRSITSMALSSGTQEEDSRARAVAEVLSDFYPKAMDKLWNHLSPDELQQAKKQAAELKGLKKF
jgi:neuraminyllactose-binding hemagglutinin